MDMKKEGENAEGNCTGSLIGGKWAYNKVADLEFVRAVGISKYNKLDMYPDAFASGMKA